LNIKSILEKLVEGKISVEDAWVLIDIENQSVVNSKCSKGISHQTNEDFLIV
jgi:hypothetical protein